MPDPAQGSEQVWEYRPTAGGGQWVEYSPQSPEEIRRTIAWLSRLMDAVFEVPGLGWRFGLDAIIGLVPALGDAASTFVSLYLLALAGRAGVPRITLARMGLNVALDMLLGAVPLVGDLFDVWFKANLRNAELLAARLEQSPGQARRATAGDWLFVGAMLALLVLLFLALAALTVFAAAALWQAAVRLFGG